MYQLQLSRSLVPAQTDDVVREITVGGLLREIASQRPTAEALVEVDLEGQTARRWTYGALLADSERLALALSARFRPGERVLVWAPNSPEWVVMEYACALAGIVLVTANPAFQAKELRYILEQSGAVAMFRVESFRGNPMAEIGAQATEGLASIREVVDLADSQALYGHGPLVFGERSPVLPTVEPGVAAQIQYTSGTTGFPKGAVLSHRGLVNNARFYASRCNVTQSSTWINIMPMFHTSGCGMVTLGCLQVACRMVLVSLFHPDAINDLIESERVTVILGVPTMIVALLEVFDQHPRDMSNLELVSCGGSMVAPELVRRVKKSFGCGFATVYGQTEASPVITQHHIDDSVDDICNTTGQPIPQTAVSIRRVDDNSVVPVGEVGEICARGPCNMIGYHADEAATAETLDEDGWLHTGDLGAMDARGYVRITGRVKEMIIRGGENHFPMEIENVLLEHPAVAEVAVVGLPDKKWGEIIACFIRSEGNQALDVRALHGYCRQHLSPQKTPTVWCKVDDFPLTGPGKFQKFLLRDGYLAGDYKPL